MFVARNCPTRSYGERISLPISTDGTTADGIFGATEYRSFAAWDTSSPAGRTEIEHWFAID